MADKKTIWSVLTECPPTFGRRLGRVALYSVLLSCALAGCMGSVTYQLAGSAGLAAMAVAILIGLISNIAGTLPACWSLGQQAPPDGKNLLGGMVVRLMVLIMLAVPTTLSGALPESAFLLWLAGAYALLLMLETTLVVSWINRRQVQP